MNKIEKAAYTRGKYDFRKMLPTAYTGRLAKAWTLGKFDGMLKNCRGLTADQHAWRDLYTAEFAA